MDQLDLAIQATAMKTPGGMKRLSQLMGVNHQTLINKCNPNTETHKLSLREAVAMMMHSGDIQILEVLAAELGYTVEPKATRGTRDLMTAVLNADAEHGDVGRSIQEAMVDGRLTAREVAKVRDEVTEAKRALDELLTTVVVMHKDKSL
jgi:hypothetical protein